MIHAEFISLSLVWCGVCACVLNIKAAPAATPQNASAGILTMFGQPQLLFIPWCRHFCESLLSTKALSVQTSRAIRRPNKTRREVRFKVYAVKGFFSSVPQPFLPLYTTGGEENQEVRGVRCRLNHFEANKFFEISCFTLMSHLNFQIYSMYKEHFNTNLKKNYQLTRIFLQVIS